MKTLIQVLTCSLIAVQMYAQQIPNQPDFPKKESTDWITFKAVEQIPAQQLAQSKTMLQLEADDDLQLLKTEEDQLGFRHYRYQQTYKGIPVEGAIYLMHEKNNQVKLRKHIQTGQRKSRSYFLPFRGISAYQLAIWQ